MLICYWIIFQNWNLTACEEFWLYQGLKITKRIILRNWKSGVILDIKDLFWEICKPTIAKNKQTNKKQKYAGQLHTLGFFLCHTNLYVSFCHCFNGTSIVNRYCLKQKHNSKQCSHLFNMTLLNFDATLWMQTPVFLRLEHQMC